MQSSQSPVLPFECGTTADGSSIGRCALIPLPSKANQQRLEPERQAHGHELARMRRVLIHAFPFARPEAVVLVDVTELAIATTGLLTWPSGGRPPASGALPSQRAAIPCRPGDRGPWAIYRSSADWDGDGKSDLGIWRQRTGVWWIHFAKGDSTAVPWGAGVDGDVPVTGDWDGDRKMDLAVWRPSSGL